MGLMGEWVNDWRICYTRVHWVDRMACRLVFMLTQQLATKNTVLAAQFALFLKGISKNIYKY